MKPISNMQKKMAKRTLFSILAILLLIVGFQWWTKNVRDPNFGTFDSAGYIAAIRGQGDESQIVLIDPNGKVTESPDFVKGSADENPEWSPDGQRIFFESDRADRQSHIFRWNPSPRFEGVQRLTLDSRSKSGLTFEVPGAESTSLDGLYLSGGTVMYFDPSNPKATRQVLPPTVQNAPTGKDQEAGRGGQFDEMYAKFGSSFKVAKWGPNKSWIACVMRHPEGGETLILQDMKSEAAPEPIPFMGERVDIDVSKTGRLVVTILNCQFVEGMAPPQAREGNIVRSPFRHGTILVDVALGGKSEMNPIVFHPNDSVAFIAPKISPDGESVAFLAGPTSGGRVEISSVYVCKLEKGGGTDSRAAMKSTAVRDAVWTTDSSKLLLTLIEGEGQAIYSVNRDGTDLKNLTKGLGSFRSPRMSPTVKK